MYSSPQIDAAGTYDFITRSSDGSNLYIDGIHVVNNDGTHATYREESGQITLTSGFHFVKATYFYVRPGDPGVSISYRGTDTAMQEASITWNEVSMPPAGCICSTGWSPQNHWPILLCESATYISDCVWYSHGQCSACAAGSFKDVNGSAACTLCLAGTYGTASAATSASTCSDCPAYSYSGAGSMDAANCSCGKGFTLIQGAGCGACAAGSFKDVNGSAACQLCPVGKYSDDTAATSASTCVDPATSSTTSAVSSTIITSAVLTSSTTRFAYILLSMRVFLSFFCVRLFFIVSVSCIFFISLADATCIINSSSTTTTTTAVLTSSTTAAATSSSSTSGAPTTRFAYVLLFMRVLFLGFASDCSSSSLCLASYLSFSLELMKLVPSTARAHQQQLS